MPSSSPPPASPRAWPSGSCSGLDYGSRRPCPCGAASLRLNQAPPAISVRPEAPGNKARKGREVPIPADLVESLADLASFHSKDQNRPMLDVSRQWVTESMKRAAVDAGIDPARAHPHALRHTYGRNCVLRGVPISVLQQWLRHQSLADTRHYVELAGAHHEWVSRL